MAHESAPARPVAVVGWSALFIVAASGLVFVGVHYAGTLVPSTVVAGVLATAWTVAIPVGLTWVIGRRRFGLDWPGLGWVGGREGAVGFARGFVVGAAPAILAMTLTVPLGHAIWRTGGGTGGDYVRSVAGFGVILLPAALWEEVVFRGLPLVLLARLFGAGPAMLTVSGLFALAHLFNPGVTPLAVVNIALAGIFLSLVFFQWGGIWASTGAHLGWNLALMALAAPVSGNIMRVAGLDYDPGGPTWLTGGEFGPEGGVLATLTLGIAATMLRLRRKPEIQA
ncbi:MAG: CPBP family intramembrane glutamic endopeptidase [Gemmatimonadota bacterium]